jgi:hypothetical protein
MVIFFVVRVMSGTSQMPPLQPDDKARDKKGCGNYHNKQAPE